jgi:hypothetical protein
MRLAHTHTFTPDPNIYPFFFVLFGSIIPHIIMSTGEKAHTDSTTAQTSTPKRSETYDSDDADIELISSDNVSFKVHFYRLQCAS